MLPTPPQIAGKHFVIYEAYYKQIDPKDAGRIEAMQAANFLKKSGLSVVVLSRIWDLSDPNGQGYLDKQGFYVAMKLVALAQMGTDLNVSNILIDTPNPPKLGDLPKVTASSVQMVPPNAPMDWAIKPADRAQYEELFESLKPESNMLQGNKVKGVLMDSKLPVDILGRIWELADQDKDGNLDRPEFVVCMQLVYQALAKKAIPAVLPPELKKQMNNSTSNHSMNNNDDGGFVANFPTDIAPPPVPPLPVAHSRAPPTVPPLPAALLHNSQAPAAPIIPLSSKDWVVSTIEKLKYDEIFERSDIDRDGLVSGGEIKDVFLQSGIPQNCLAHIWSLCDTNSTGKLNGEQFALAMWLVDRKRKGMDPPAALEPIMVPPGMRQKVASAAAGGAMAAIEEPLMKEVQPAYTNPELEMVAKEIEEILKERRQLENEVYHKEAEIRVKSGEVRSLQSEFDTLAATLKQLENQKGEAQKRLDDLKLQSERLHEETQSVIEEIQVARDKVTKIRDQCTKQEETIKEQETELDAKKSELQTLKDEETALETEHKQSTAELEKLSTNLQDTQLQISQIKAMFTQLQENQRQMNDAVNSCKTALESEDIGTVSDYTLKLNPEFREVKEQLVDMDKPKPDPSEEANVTNGDQFKDNNSNSFGAFGEDSFGAGSRSAAGGFDDSFGSAFNGGSGTTGSDPFRDKENRVNNNSSQANDFDADPFAILHAPTSTSQKLGATPTGPPARPESPSPALPPKKAKQPPPRPAPPRPMQGPTPTKLTPSDGFADTSGSSFANFDAFDNKKTEDFAEDPFKDYRYEDVFNIEDPFADEADVAKPSSMDDLFSSAKLEAFPSHANNLSSAPATTGWPSGSPPVSLERPKGLVMQKNDLSKNTNEFETNNNFANFANVFQNTASTTINTDPFLDKSNNNSSSSNKNDFFADFNDNFGGPATKVSNKTSAFDAFGGGAFGNGNGTTEKGSFKAAFDDDDDDPFGNPMVAAKNNNKSGKSNGKVLGLDVRTVEGKESGGRKKGPMGRDAIARPSNAKYSEDYSNNFDSDLEEVLKRSLFDQ